MQSEIFRLGMSRCCLGDIPRWKYARPLDLDGEKDGGYSRVPDALDVPLAESRKVETGSNPLATVFVGSEGYFYGATNSFVWKMTSSRYFISTQ